MAFGFDPSIILSGLPKPPQEASLNETLRTLADLATSRQQQQQGQATLAEMLRKQAEGKTLADVVRANAGNLGAVPQELARAGLAGPALDWMGKQAAAQRAGSGLRELGLQRLRGRLSVVQGPEQYAELIAPIPADERAELGLPDEYDPVAVQGVIAGGVPASRLQSPEDLAAKAAQAALMRARADQIRGAPAAAAQKAEETKRKEGEKRTTADTKDLYKLRDTIDANKAVVKYRAVNAELGNLRELAKGSSGASDMAIVFAFMKALDPESAVREGEYAAAARTGTPDERMMGLVSKWYTGGPLSPGQRQAFIKAAEAAQSGHKSRYGREVKKYKLTADKRGFDLAELGIEDAEPEQKKGGGGKAAPGGALSDAERAELDALRTEIVQ